MRSLPAAVSAAGPVRAGRERPAAEPDLSPPVLVGVEVPETLPALLLRGVEGSVLATADLTVIRLDLTVSSVQNSDLSVDCELPTLHSRRDCSPVMALLYRPPG